MKNTGQGTKSTPLYDFGPLTFDFCFLLINDEDCKMQLSTLNSNISRCYLNSFVHNFFFFYQMISDLNFSRHVNKKLYTE